MSRLLLVLLLCAAAQPARAQHLAADLSAHLVGVSTGFDGAEVVVFGSTDGPGDVVVVVRGPERRAVVQRKGRIGLVWTNVRAMRFERVPSFYRVAASRPLECVAAPAILAREELGADRLRLEPAEAGAPDAPAYRDAFLRAQEDSGAYDAAVGTVRFLGDTLFRTAVTIPAGAPVGAFTVRVYLFRGGAVVAAQSMPLILTKTGLDAEVSAFARTWPAGYGLLAVCAAAGAGYAASLAFRRG